MKRHAFFHRTLSLVLALVLVLGNVLPAGAVQSRELRLEMTQVDNSAVSAPAPMIPMDTAEPADPDGIVRVSIQLAKAPAMDRGFELKTIALNEEAALYQQGLRQEQQALTARIEREVLNGAKLDVVWSMTLAANVISANVPRHAIDKIARLPGVSAVVEENRYSPDVVSVGGSFKPNMAVSNQMTGAVQSWLEGCTGAGSLIAVIDTGLDTDHQSFDPEAFEHAISLVGSEKGTAPELLEVSDIEAVLPQLNAYKRVSSLTAQDLYINAKAAFGFNYVDGDLDVTHDNDGQGEHGSHVAGIAAANRYLERDGEFVDALDTVHVAGAAPDAQLLVMKVFGKDGGAYDSDIMVAIEDALILGADVVNLSLGSSSAGDVAVENEVYRQLLDRVVDSGMILSASAGNDGEWAMNSTNGHLYNTDVNFDTVGVPASYVSALAVASVDNDGLISSSLVVGGRSMGYTEALTDASGVPFGNAAIATLDTSADGSGTDYEFVMIDGIGTAADYAGLDLTGKVVLCSRGELYYAEKANIAAELGAAALIVYNTESGTINMDLTDYHYAMPAVFLTKANADAIRSLAQDNGGWYSGTITVKGALTGNYENSAFKTMSSFSSWGVPGDLSLKPEITAPGGAIYSVNGAVAETDQYELMSGTSMAAPQISGLVALVQQYLREEGITVPGLNARALAQSLLMSTAEPLLEGTSGSYYSVFQQGAGLANAADALETPVYLTVEGMDDGKVKAELGDDPDRTGSYRFAFTLHNLENAAHTYLLSADLFTQSVFSDDSGIGYLDTLTRPMDADVTFTLNGLELPTGELAELRDFDGNGLLTKADAQLLLEHVTLGNDLPANAENADLSGDGTVNTYDVHLYLKALASRVEIPAGGSVTLEVTMTLTEAEKARLDAENPNGAYVEAYVFADAVAENDALLPRLSIPVLGFYGGWTESGMFDVGTQVTHATGEELRASYFGNTYGNALGIIYGDRPNEVWYFGGNPIVPDAAYLPERNAVNIERGDRFFEWSYAPMRNAVASRFTVTDGQTGELLYEKLGGGVEAAFYYVAYASWMNTPQYFEVDYKPELTEGQSALMTLTLAPEYYANADGSIDWDALGAGASLEMPITVDNEYPEILSVVVNEETNTLEVTASDDQYLAGVLLYDVTGRKLLGKAGTTAEAQAGETITFEIPLNTVDGYKFIIQTADYACNMVTYELRHTIGEPDPLPTRLAFDESFQSWSTFYNGQYGWTSEEWFASELVIQSATAIGETVLACDPSGNLYALPVEDMFDGIFIRRLDVALTDMAYDALTDTVYAVDDSSALYTLDKYSGELAKVGTIGVSTNTLAADGNGTFFCSHYRPEGYDYHFEVYTFTLETIGSPQLLGDVYQKYYYEPSGIGAMEFDSNRGVLGWFARVPGYSYDDSYYFEIDPATGDSLLSYSYTPPTPFTKAAVALVYPTWGEEANAWAEPTDVPTGIAFDKAEVEILRGYSKQLGVNAYPWTLSNKAVTYTVADPAIVSVDHTGAVTGLKPGTTTVTAVSVLDPSVTGSCTVTVRELEVDVEGILCSEDGTPIFYTWDLTQDSYVRGQAISNQPMSVAQLPDGESFYLLDASKGTMHLLDRQGKDLTAPSEWYLNSNYWVWDLACSEMFSGRLYGIRENLLLAPFDPMSPEMVTFDLSMYGVTFLAGITSGGTETITYQGYYGEELTAESEIFYMIDNKNRVWRCNMFLESGDRWDMVYSIIPSNLDADYPAEFAGRSSLVLGEDGALYFSAWTGDTNELYRLTYDAATETYESIRLGDFGKDVWPAVILEAASNAAADAAPAGTARCRAAADGAPDAVIDTETQSYYPGVLYDYRESTVRVPIQIADGSNGLFELRYDPAVLTLAELGCHTSSLTAMDTSTPGVFRMGYANHRAFSSVLADLTFAYTGTEPTEITLTTLEDGTDTTETVQTVRLHAPVNPFVDVTGEDFFFDPVMWAVEQGITNGVDATHFGPNKACSRAEAVTFLWRAAGCPEPESSVNPFVDVTGTDFFCKAVLWAVEAGITNGVDATHFGPYLTCNRATVVTFLWCYEGSDAPDSDAIPFTDVQPGQWYTDAILWAVQWQITNGMGDGTFGIGLPCNRAQIVTFLQRNFNP